MLTGKDGVAALVAKVRAAAAQQQKGGLQREDVPGRLAAQPSLAGFKRKFPALSEAVQRNASGFYEVEEAVKRNVSGVYEVEEAEAGGSQTWAASSSSLPHWLTAAKRRLEHQAAEQAASSISGRATSSALPSWKPATKKRLEQLAAEHAASITSGRETKSAAPHWITAAKRRLEQQAVDQAASITSIRATPGWGSGSLTNGTTVHRPCGVATCTYVCTWHPSHCCKKCLATQGREHGVKCDARLQNATAGEKKKPEPEEAKPWQGSYKAVKKELGKVLDDVRNDFCGAFPQALAVFRQAAGTAVVGSGKNPDAAKVRILELLEFAAMKGGPKEYGESLALVEQLKVSLDMRFMTKLFVILTSRVPVPVGMIRITLNLALPPDAQCIPLEPPPACARKGRVAAMLEDGEIVGNGAGSLSSSSWSIRARHPAPLSQVDPNSIRGRVLVDDKAAGAYYGHFVSLLHLEALEELQDMTDRLHQPPTDLARHGWLLQGMRVKKMDSQPVGKSKTSPVPGKKVSARLRVAFGIPPDVDFSRLRLRPGDSVLLSRTSPLKDFIMEGLVADAPIVDDHGGERRGRISNEIVVMFDKSPQEPDLYAGLWRLDKGANRTSYERQLVALMQLGMSRPRDLWRCLTTTGVGGSNVDAWAAKMRNMMDGRHQASLEACGGLADSEFDTDPAVDELKDLAAEEPSIPKGGDEILEAVRRELLHEDAEFSLNPSQRNAVSEALGRRLSLVQGPPGTGKTHVSVRLLELWATRFRGMGPLLATSDSNIAVDNIAEGCYKRGLRVVRVGRLEKITSQLENVSLETKLREKRAAERAESAFDSMEECGFFIQDWSRGGSEESKKLQRQRDYGDKMEILRDADVICTTTIAAGSDFLNAMRFGAILMDEVAQATELSAVVPIVLRGGQRLVLVGDHCQLPPSVCSMEAEQRGLSLSLFGRLAAQGLDPFFLDTQFRMHPSIAHFSAQEFYHGRLRTGVSEESRVPPMGFQWPQEGHGVAFINCDGVEQRDGESRSNAEEAYAVAEIVGHILAAKELSVLDVGIVSPYSAQVRQLRQTVRGQLSARLRAAGVDLTGGLKGRQGAKALEIASVDAFQGREKELIVFSAVRSNQQGNVGFLADWRRLNVMLTRARRGVIVIGNAETLQADPTWSSWLRWAYQSGFVVENSTPAPREASSAGKVKITPAWTATTVPRLGSLGKGKDKTILQAKPKFAPWREDARWSGGHAMHSQWW